MGSKTTNLYKLNSFFFLYLIFTIICILVDYQKLIIFYLDRSDSFLTVPPLLNVNISLIVSILMLFLIIGFLLGLRSKIKEIRKIIIKPILNKMDFLALVIILIITLIRLPIPDSSWDVLQYHLFLQDFHFENNILYNFFPANIQTFTLPLGDRLFGVFRSLLGYRGGTILNSLVLLIIFFQIKEVLIYVFNIKNSTKLQSNLISAYSLFIISTEFLLANIGIYMIDILMIPFYLELLKITFVDNSEGKKNYWFIGLLVGISVSIKLTSLLYCGLLMILFLIKKFRTISLKSLLITFSLFVFPILSYMVYNYTQTNNPIYPYLDILFNSPYYSPKISEPYLGNLGPQTFIEFLLWPIIILFQPDKISQLNYYSGRISLGVIVALISLIVGIKKKILDDLYFPILLLVSIYLWSFLIGIRYGLFLELLSGIIIVEFLVKNITDIYHLFSTFHLQLKHKNLFKIFSSSFTEFLSKENEIMIPQHTKKKISIKNTLTIFIFFAFCSQLIFTFYLSVLTNKVDWSLREIQLLSDPDLYFNNFRSIGKDFNAYNNQNNPTIYNITDEIDIWIVGYPWLAPTTGYVNLINSDIPIIYVPFKEINQLSENILKENLLELDYKNKNIYMINRTSYQLFEESLKKDNIIIEKIFEIQPSFSNSPIQLVKVNINHIFD